MTYQDADEDALRPYSISSSSSQVVSFFLHLLCIDRAL